MDTRRVDALIPSGAVDPSIPDPNLDRVVMRPVIQHRIDQLNRVQERSDIDLLVCVDVVESIEKVAAIDGHKVLRSKRAALPRYSGGGPREDRGIANKDGVSGRTISQRGSKIAQIQC